MAILDDKHYVHVQTDADVEWVVNHNLDKYPAVSIVNESGKEIFGQVNYVDSMVLRVKFSETMRGRVYCN